MIYNVADFETKGIDFEALVRTSPAPVGLAVWFKAKGEKPRYYAFGHPTNNGIYELVKKGKVKRIGPCTEDDAKKQAQRMWADKHPVLFQNAPFDLSVAEEHWHIEVPPWDKIHDTKYLLFFKDPHAPALSLKPSAERYLNEPPEEKDALREWLIEHKVVPKDASEDTVGGNIWRCPGDLVALYAIGDLTRTDALFDLLHPWVVENEMEAAYNRERRIMPDMLRNEYEGIPFDLERAERDVVEFTKALEISEAWLRKRLKIKGEFNWDSDLQVAEALDKAKVVTEWTWTKGSKDGKRKPQRSVSKKNLTLDKFRDPEVFYTFGYRNRLQTVMSLNILPWIKMAKAGEGKIFTMWNQVKATDVAGDPKGTRSGRLSCSRFQNISKDFSDKGDGYKHPTKIKVPELPLVRRYLLPDKGGVFCHRDYNQQEFRILAHFENGNLLESYLNDPTIDYHNNMQRTVKEITGTEFERRLIKIINFSTFYNTGAPKVAEQMNKSVEEAKQILKTAKSAVPGIVALNRELMQMGRDGEPIRTWGKRLYYCEPPSYSEKFKRKMTWEYKLLNYLIQGSAADCTKEALCRLFDHPKFRNHARFLVTVHDEINVSAHTPKDVAPTMAIMKEVMESLGSVRKGAAGVCFDVPMLTDGKTGPSWGDLKKYEDPKGRKAA